jgi:Arc/MetJ-type ribon-helix-helix transcriptional regulator
LKLVPVRLPDKIVERLDELVEEGYYANRSAAIRVIITHHLLSSPEKTSPREA